jgi:hypothetical protein
MSQSNPPAEDSRPLRQSEVRPAVEYTCSRCGSVYLSRHSGSPCQHCTTLTGQVQKGDSEYTRKVLDDNDLIK